MRPLTLSLALVASSVPILAGCGNAPDEQAAQPAAAQKQKETYPAPRWPSYFQPPKSIEDLMPAARQLVRNKSGFLGVGMGVLQSGETVLIVPTLNSDPMVVEAVTR